MCLENELIERPGEPAKKQEESPDLHKPVVRTWEDFKRGSIVPSFEKEPEPATE